MLTYGPKQLKQYGVLTGKWDFTVTGHDGKPEPAGYCKLAKRDDPGGHHDTKEQAVQCFVAYTLDNIKFDGSNIMMQPCFLCERMTFKCAMVANDPFVPICSEYCGNRFKDVERQRYADGAFEVAAEICDDGL